MIPNICFQYFAIGLLCNEKGANDKNAQIILASIMILLKHSGQFLKILFPKSFLQLY